MALEQQASALSNVTYTHPNEDGSVSQETDPATAAIPVIAVSANAMSSAIEQGRQAGFAVDHARDGRTGLSLALAEPYDVDVVDLMLPELDGLALIDALRDRGMPTPVIILTARGTVGDRILGLNTGADDYLPKPFDLDELEARVRALARRRPQRRDRGAAQRWPAAGGGA